MLNRIDLNLEKPITTFEELTEVMKETVAMRFNLTEIAEYNALIDKSMPRMGLPANHEDSNRCPGCGHLFLNDKDALYCRYCGQRIVFTEPPAEEEEVVAEEVKPEVIPFDSEDYNKEFGDES